MTREVIAAHPHMPLGEAVALMQVAGTSRLPVIDRERRLVGILSSADFIRPPERNDADEYATDIGPFLPGIIERAITAHKDQLRGPVSARMRAPQFSLMPDDSVVRAAEVMAMNGIRSLPVIAPGTGKLVGVVSWRDVLAWVAGLE